MDQRPNCDTPNTETARRKHRQYPTKHKCRKGLREQDSICPQIKAKPWQVSPHEA